MKREPVAEYDAEPAVQLLRGTIVIITEDRPVALPPRGSEFGMIGRAHIPRSQNLTISATWNPEQPFTGERAQILRWKHTDQGWTLEDPPRVNLSRPPIETFGERTTL